MIKEIKICNNVGKGLATPTKESKRSCKQLIPYQPGTANNQKEAADSPTLSLGEESVVKKLLCL